jgi:hypothetical protein
MTSMEANFTLRQHEQSKNPDMEVLTPPIAHPRHPGEQALDELIRIVLFFGYFGVVFALLSVHKSIILSEYHLEFPEYFFAIVNLLVFVKILLSTELFHLRTRVSRQALDKSRPLYLPSQEERFAAFTRSEFKEAEHFGVTPEMNECRIGG